MIKTYADSELLLRYNTAQKQCTNNYRTRSVQDLKEKSLPQIKITVEVIFLTA